MKHSTRPDCDVAYRLQLIVKEQVYAQRERKALEKQARDEGGVVRGGVIVKRTH